MAEKDENLYVNLDMNVASNILNFTNLAPIRQQNIDEAYYSGSQMYLKVWSRIWMENMVYGQRMTFG